MLRLEMAIGYYMSGRFGTTYVKEGLMLGANVGDCVGSSSVLEKSGDH